jgi:hypothetical protein
VAGFPSPVWLQFTSAISENPKKRLDSSGKSVLLMTTSLNRCPTMKKTLSGSRSSLHGLADILAQAPLVAAAFGRWLGFVLMMTTMLALFAVSLVTAIVIGKTAIDLFG